MFIIFLAWRSKNGFRDFTNVFFSTEEDPHKEVRVRWARLSGMLRMTPVDSIAVPRPPSSKAHQNGDVGKVHEYRIVFTGFNLEEQALKDWLKICCKPVCYINNYAMARINLSKIPLVHTCHLTPPPHKFN